MLMDNVTGWIRKLTEADVIATLTGIISSLGGAGLVGLLAAALLYKIFTR